MISEDPIPIDTFDNWAAIAEYATTGDTELDVASGCTLARLCIQLCKQEGHAQALAVTLSEIIKAAELGPLEIGFIATVAETARAGSMN